MSTPIKSLIDYATKAVGGGYVWGAEGQTCSLAVRQEMASRSSAGSNASNILGVCAKWDGKKIWDCSGLFRGETASRGRRRSGGATTIWDQWTKGGARGVIATMPKDVAGLAVFKGDGTNMSHIGLYMGDGTVIDARGSSQGVLHQPLSGNKWTHWAYLADEYDYGSAAQSEDVGGDADLSAAPSWYGTVKTKNGNGISLWSDEKKTVATVKVPENEIVAVFVPAQYGMLPARYNGVNGLVDAAYLLTTQAPSDSGSASDTDATDEPDTSEDYIKLITDARDALNRAINMLAGGLG